MNAVVELPNNPLDSLSKDQLENQITQLAANINAANYQLLLLIAEFDRRGAWGDWGCRSCAYWLNWKCGIALGAAREKIRVAHALVELPRISAAFESGKLSYSKARAMTRIANADNEEFLLRLAEYGSANHIEKTVRHFQRVTADESQQVHDRRGVKYYWDDDGILTIQASLPAEQGALFLKALDTVVDKLEQDDWKTESEDNRRADALVLMAENQLEHTNTVSKTSDRYQVIVHTDVSQEVESHRVENGPALARETVERLGCDASVSHLVSDKGEPLSIGRKSRTIPTPMRRALKVRDQGCRFPGCGSTHYVDGHHIQHWSRGGETGLHNLVTLCRHHHRLMHEGGYGVTRAESGEFCFTRPDGSVIEPAPEVPSAKKIAQTGGHPWSLQCERMDYRLAMDALIQLDQKHKDVSAETDSIHVAKESILKRQNFN